MNAIVKDRPVVETALKPKEPSLFDVIFFKKDNLCITDEVITLKHVFRVDENTAIDHVERAAVNGLSIVFTGSAEIAETKADQANAFLQNTMYGEKLLAHCWFTFKRR